MARRTPRDRQVEQHIRQDGPVSKALLDCVILLRKVVFGSQHSQFWALATLSVRCLQVVRRLERHGTPRHVHIGSCSWPSLSSVVHCQLSSHSHAPCTVSHHAQKIIFSSAHVLQQHELCDSLSLLSLSLCVSPSRWTYVFGGAARHLPRHLVATERAPY